MPWFPHDNDPELLKELCHEAGRPRLVYFGTPAGGAGIHGCIEMGCSVIALQHHKKHLGPFLVERAVEAMLGNNTLVFHNEGLLARAKQLRIGPDEKKKQEDQKDEEKDAQKERKRESKKDGKKKRKKSSSDSDSDSESPDEADETPKKKKKGKQ